MAIVGLRIPGYQCPSDRQTQTIRETSGGRSRLFSATQGFNMGTWAVYAPDNPTVSDGPFYPDSELSLAKVTDGTSRTILAAEVKAWQPYLRNGGPPRIFQRQRTKPPRLRRAKDIQKSLGTPDGRVQHTGFTATLVPNTLVPHEADGKTWDVDDNSWLEGKFGFQGKPTFGIVTSRSYHDGMVQVAMLDGSVTRISNAVDLQVWRSGATRAGHETIQLPVQ